MGTSVPYCYFPKTWQTQHKNMHTRSFLFLGCNDTVINVTDGITSQRASNIYTNCFMVSEKHKGVQKELTLRWTKQHD